jgi:glycosyltransferase involved in cell wall biosynthesis
MTRIAVCVCTFRRPAGLAACLEGIAAQCWAGRAAPDIEVVVVENEADGPGRAVCRRYRAHPLHYFTETRPGISPARNRCLAAAVPNYDLIAFIDDDEVPEPDWLRRLLTAYEQTGADIVCGPAFPRYLAPPPRWLRRERFHDPARRRTGEPPAYCATNNVLFATRIVRTTGLAFDDRVAPMGVGEDVLFFSQAMRAGFRAVWCAEAVVWETVPPERMTASWLIRRAYRIGVCDSVLARAVRGRAVAVAGTLVAGVGRLVAHAALLPLALPGGKGRVVRRLRGFGYGLGRLAGLVGLGLRKPVTADAKGAP